MHLSVPVPDAYLIDACKLSNGLQVVCDGVLDNFVRGLMGPLAVAGSVLVILRASSDIKTHTSKNQARFA